MCRYNTIINSVKFNSSIRSIVYTCTYYSLWACDGHVSAEEIELKRTLGDRLIHAASVLRTLVQQEVRTGQTSAGSQLVAGAGTAAAVRMTRTTHSVRVRILQVWTTGNAVRTVLVTAARAAVFRSLRVKITGEHFSLGTLNFDPVFLEVFIISCYGTRGQ